MKRVIATATAWAALATGAGGCDNPLEVKEYGPQSNEIGISAAVMSDEQKAVIRTTYDRLQVYWAGSLTAKLVLLEGEQETVCTRYEGVARFMITALGVQGIAIPKIKLS